MKVRTRLAAAGAAVTLVLTASPATAAPRVAATIRHEPQAIATAVDPEGRVYTLANVEGTRTRVLLRSYTPGGTLRWERTWAPDGGSFFGLDLTAADGMIAVTGRVAPTDLTGDGCDDVWTYGWIVRVWRPGGSPLWQRSEPGWRTCRVFATAGRTVAIGGGTVVVAASYADEYGGWFELVSMNLQGGQRWTRRVEVPGSENERVGGIAIGMKGAVFVAATRNAMFLDSEERDQDAMLARYDADGTLAWLRTVAEGPLGPDDDRDRGTSVALTPDGVVFGAVMDEPSGPYVARIAQYGWQGSLRWERRFPGAYPTWETVDVAPWEGGTVVAGTEVDADRRGTHVVLRRLGAAGGVVWTLHVGPDDDLAWRMTGLDADDGTIAVLGGPSSVHRWSRVWLLRARTALAADARA